MTFYVLNNYYNIYNVYSTKERAKKALRIVLKKYENIPEEQLTDEFLESKFYENDPYLDGRFYVFKVEEGEAFGEESRLDSNICLDD